MKHLFMIAATYLVLVSATAAEPVVTAVHNGSRARSIRSARV
jgi:hypothetical protein